MNYMGDLLRKLRLEKGMTQLELANKLGLRKQTITQYEKGNIKNLKRSTIARLAEIFDVSPAVFIKPEDTVSQYGIKSIDAAYCVPIIGTLACGSPILAEQNYIGEAWVDTKYKGVNYALVAKGDSMINARIFDGDIVYIREQPTVENGEIAAVLIDNEATLKRVYAYSNRLELRTDNTLFPVLNYEGEELQQVRVLGKAIAFSSLIR